MPEYLYECVTCKKRFYETHSMTLKEWPVVLCDCGSEEPARKLISKETVVSYNGSGWTRKAQANEAAGIPAGVAKTAEELGRL